MKTIVFADDAVLVQSGNNLVKWQNRVNREVAEVTDWLIANTPSLNISKTKHILITKKHVNTDSFKINVNDNRTERISITSNLV